MKKIAAFIFLIAATVVSEIPAHALLISQERISYDGVLISRPNPTQAMLADFVSMNAIRDIETYARWLSNNVRYTKDSRERWQAPEETMMKRVGDCEDFAFLSQAILKLLGYDAHVLAMDRKTDAHAICYFQKNGEYVYFDNAFLRPTYARTKAEFFRDILRAHEAKRLFEIDAQGNAQRVLFRIS